VGNNNFKQCDISKIDIKHVKRVDCGEDHTVILGDDGKVNVIGSNLNNQCNLSLMATDVDAVDIACGKLHTAILLADGKIYLTGSNGFNQCDQNELVINKMNKKIEKIYCGS